MLRLLDLFENVFYASHNDSSAGPSARHPFSFFSFSMNEFCIILLLELQYAKDFESKVLVVGPTWTIFISL